MTSSKPGAESGQAPAIFLSYRRDDTSSPTGRLHDILRQRFAGRVFMDIDKIEGGQHFVKAIDEAVGGCKVLLVMIGRRWLSILNQRRGDPKDFVRREVAGALARGVTVIPVLVEGARMPGEDALPDELKSLWYLNAVELSGERWAYDVEQLVKTLEKHVGPCNSAPGGDPLGPAKGPGVRRVATAVLTAAVLTAAVLVGAALAGRSLLSGPSEAEVREQDQALELTGKALAAADNLLSFMRSWDALVKTAETEEDGASLQTQLDQHVDNYNAAKTEWKGKQLRWEQLMARPAALSASWSGAQDRVGQYMECVDGLYIATFVEEAPDGGNPADKFPDKCEDRKNKAGESLARLKTDLDAARR